MSASSRFSSSRTWPRRRGSRAPAGPSAVQPAEQGVALAERRAAAGGQPAVLGLVGLVDSASRTAAIRCRTVQRQLPSGAAWLAGRVEGLRRGLRSAVGRRVVMADLPDWPGPVDFECDAADTAPDNRQWPAECRCLVQSRAHAVRLSARPGPGRPAGGPALRRAAPCSCSSATASWSPCRTCRRASCSVVAALGVVGRRRSAGGCAARAYVVRLDDDGYRVRLVRGAGVSAARWTDVEDAGRPPTRAASPCVVLRLRDGRTTTIPVGALAGDREEFVARPAGPAAARSRAACRRLGPDSARPRPAVPCSLSERLFGGGVA